MTKLRIPVGVVVAFLGLAIALQAVVQAVQYLRHFHVADRMILLDQFCGNRTCTFANPAQRRLRIPARLLIDQRFECRDQIRVRLREGLAAGSRTTHATPHRLGSALEFNNAFTDRLARQTAGPAHQRNSAVTQAHRFSGCHDASRSLVQMRPRRTKLAFQIGNGVH